MRYEEQVANQLASAVTKHRLTPDDKTFVVGVLRTALQSLAEKIEPDEVAALYYDNVLDALHALVVHPLKWHPYTSEVVPAQAGIQSPFPRLWMPACAGMTLRLEARSRYVAQLNG